MPPAGSREAPTPTGELLDRYADYLRLRRGLKASTIRNYTNHARDFLNDRERLQVEAVSAHQLRHTAATEMLRAGSSLREVGQVLRHRGSEVTSIYAKVDRRALAALVQP
jgi:site-specific recombinase XerD